MTMPGQSSHGIPADPRYVIAQQLDELRRRIQRLETANPLQATTISEGTFEVDDDNGNPIIKIGDTGFFVAGSQSGMTVRRADGSLALSLTDFVALWDKSGNYIVTDDAVSGQGLARPYLSAGTWMDFTTPQTTTSSDWATIQTLEMRKTHPKIEGQFLVYVSDSTTTGEVRIANASDGSQVGSIQEISSFAYTPFGPYDLPGGNLERIALNLQVRRTGGSGSVGVRGTSIRSIESNPV